jgi:hypothetical protein
MVRGGEEGGLTVRHAAEIRGRSNVGTALQLALFVGGLCLVTPGALPAQQEQQERQEQQEQADARALPDSTFTGPPISPGGAFFRSLIIPGWAQARLGAESRGAGYFFVWAFSIFMVARTQYRLDIAKRNEEANPALVEARTQQREDWMALAIFTAFFSGADGWVSVHLYGFDEKTGLSPENVAFRVGWKIPVGP